MFGHNFANISEAANVANLGCCVLVQNPDPVQIVKVHSCLLQSLPGHY